MKPRLLLLAVALLAAVGSVRGADLDITFSAATGNSITLNWVAYGSFASPMEYRVTRTPGSATPVYIGTALTFADSSLTKNTAYTYTVSVYSNSGAGGTLVGATAAPPSQTTANDVTLNADSILMYATSNVNEYVLSWPSLVANTGASTAGPPATITYTVEYKKVASGSYIGWTGYSSGTSAPALVLAPGTNYNVRITVSSGILGTASVNQVFTGRTYSVAPVIGTALAAGTITATQVPLSWTVTSSGQESNLALAQVLSRNGVDLTTLPAGTASYTGSFPQPFSFTDSGLSPYTPYTYSIRATTVAGNSTSSPVSALSVTTASAPPTVAFLTTAPYITQNSVTDLDPCTLYSYTLTATTNDGQTFTTSAKSFTTLADKAVLSPTVTSLNYTYNAFSFAWTNSALSPCPGSGGTSGYQLSLSVNSGAATLVNPTTTTSYSLSAGVLPSSTYAFYLRFTNTNNNVSADALLTTFTTFANTPTVTALGVTANSSNSLTFQWTGTANGGGPLFYKVDRTSPSVLSIKNFADSLTSATDNTGLLPFTDYTYSVQARNSQTPTANLSTVATATFKTAASQATFSSSTVSSTPAANSILFSWTAATWNSLTGDYSWTISGNPTPSPSSGVVTTNSVTVSNLRAYNQYTFTVYARSGSGNTYDSAVLTASNIQTLAAAPTIVAGQFTSTGQTYNSVSLEWNGVLTLINGPTVNSASQWLVERRLNNPQGSFVSVGTFAAATLSTTDNDASLAPYTVYDYRLTVRNDQYSTTATLSSIRTAAAPPTIDPSQIEPSFSANGPTSYAVTFDLAGAYYRGTPASVSATFLLRYKTTGSGSFTSAPTFTTDTTTVTMQASQVYDLEWTITNAGPLSSTPSTGSVSVPALAPYFNAPTITTSDVTTTTADISWPAPTTKNGNDPIVYWVQYTAGQPNPGNQTIQTSSDILQTTSTTVSGLYPGVIYTWTVSAKNANSGFSSPFSTVSSLRQDPADPIWQTAPTLSASGQTTSAFVFNWAAPVYAQDDPNNLKYRVVATQITASPAFPDPTLFSKTVSINSAAVTVAAASNTGYEPYVQYNVTVHVKSSTDNFVPSNTFLTVTTAGSKPSWGALTQSSLTGDRSSRQITLEWPDVPYPQDASTLTYSVSRGGTTIISGLTTSSYVDTGLTPFTDYAYIITATNSKGSTALGTAVTFKTTEATPLFAGSETLTMTPNANGASITYAAPNFPYGTLSGYTVSVVDTSFTDAHVTPTQSSNSAANVFTRTITSLFPFRTYAVTIQATNGAGTSPPSDSRTGTFTTSPSAPILDESLLDAQVTSNTSITVSWKGPQPWERNSVLSSYRVECYMQEEDGAWTFVNAPTRTPLPADNAAYNTATQQSYQEVFSGLLPYRNYTFNVFVIGSSLTSSAIEVLARTLPGLPPTPLQATVIPISDTQARVSWPAVDDINGPIVSYVVEGQRLLPGYNETWPVPVVYAELTNGRNVTTVSGLAAESKYRFRVRTFTAAGFSLGPFGTSATTLEAAAGSQGWVAAVVLIPLILIALVALLLVRRRQGKPMPWEPLQQRWKQRQNKDANNSMMLMGVQHQQDNMAGMPSRIVPAEELADCVAQLHANSDLGFAEEYEALNVNEEYATNAALMPANKSKNRYANILPYDHSRVRLSVIPGVEGSDYVNANYIDGYRKSHAYIACQGPLPDTFDDFWRMVWEQRSAVIVMVTNEEEKGRVKCHRYWPDDSEVVFGDVEVRMTRQEELSEFITRVFSLKNIRTGETRTVHHLQFTGWPDHGVPHSTSSLIKFVKQAKAVQPNDAGPMVIHCSAGVGRTGTFIVTDMSLERTKVENNVDIFGCVSALRRNRMYMVQTEEQYMFIYQTLADAVANGDSEVSARDLAQHVARLAQHNKATDSSGFEEEFRLFQQPDKKKPTTDAATLSANKSKNRFATLLPYDHTRVKLNAIPGVNGSDYINASFLLRVAVACA
ncbi:receptor-linked protein tyrosine phosphatase [Capsaspora owczarzaki ATCC 30864]|uniref:receptor-linked protein tyrosine phosphatase n=1 Tax=Capsaspora owczarzaki (strain ATCC 30864) TaxID=595528 RepID=UPI00035248CD|nr:receptor-linked protein tyrosine phosphatase [Capsaspora owczarzaki ATCC 30864]|eukprot:XP_004365141.2 receptor-linked protein tyrosine phosphatase [Capsaspora owczarzaki ATCC 30864]